MLAHPQGEAPDFAFRELLDNAVDLCTVAPALPPEHAGVSTCAWQAPAGSHAR